MVFGYDYQDMEIFGDRLYDFVMKRHEDAIYLRFPPSPPCRCDICGYFCHRPGWPLVREARLALEAGYGPRMMLELSEDHSYGVLSPAFKGNEGYLALQQFSQNGCTFLNEHLCDIHHLPFLPLECRFCHHDRMGKGTACHEEIGRDWHTSKGRRLVRLWLGTVRLPSHLLQSIEHLARW